MKHTSYRPAGPCTGATAARRSLGLSGSPAVVLWLVLPVSLLGCAHYHARPFLDDSTASSIIEHRETAGLHAAVRDLSRTSAKYFDRDLTGYGYVPVQVLLELDARSDAAFNLRREDLRLVLRDGTRLPAADPERVIAAVSFSHWRSFFGFLALLPGFFVTSSVTQANQDLETDYTSKAFRSVRLSPNMRSYSGVVFFELPGDRDGELDLEDALVEMTVYQESRDRNTLGTHLEFPVYFSRE